MPRGGQTLRRASKVQAAYAGPPRDATGPGLSGLQRKRLPAPRGRINLHHGHQISSIQYFTPMDAEQSLMQVMINAQDQPGVRGVGRDKRVPRVGV